MNKPEWLQRIIEREGKATSGIWVTLEDGRQELRVETTAPKIRKTICYIYGNRSKQQKRNDGEFIANARTDITTLISALNKAYEVLEPVIDYLENTAMPDYCTSPYHHPTICGRCCMNEVIETLKEALSFNPLEVIND